MFDQYDCFVFCSQRYFETSPVQAVVAVIKLGTRFKNVVLGGTESVRVVAAIDRVENYVRAHKEKHCVSGKPFQYFQSYRRWV